MMPEQTILFLITQNTLIDAKLPYICYKEKKNVDSMLRVQSKLEFIYQSVKLVLIQSSAMFRMILDSSYRQQNPWDSHLIFTKK